MPIEQKQSHKFKTLGLQYHYSSISLSECAKTSRKVCLFHIKMWYPGPLPSWFPWNLYYIFWRIFLSMLKERDAVWITALLAELQQRAAPNISFWTLRKDSNSDPKNLWALPEKGHWGQEGNNGCEGHSDFRKAFAGVLPSSGNPGGAVGTPPPAWAHQKLEQWAWQWGEKTGKNRSTWSGKEHADVAGGRRGVLKSIFS